MDNQFTVSELNEYVNNLLSNHEVLSHVSVKGEISNYINHSSGHRYFSLKDKEGLISCAMFSFNGRHLKFEPKNGDKVIATGQIGVYKRDGRYQLYVKEMVIEGVGNLYEKYEALKNKLLEEGLFDKSHKKPLPMLPKKIGIVTSCQGAAVQDMINIITRRFDNSYIAIYPAKVQGENAHLSIIDGIAYFNNDPDTDVIIIGRGGGSLEDLWAFNEEALARAVYDSKLPIISAVGHETDFSISDFVADLRAPTPSAAAELCVPQKSEMKRAISTKLNALGMCMDNVITKRRSKVQLYISSLMRFDPVGRINQQRQTVDSQRMQMTGIIKNLLTEKKGRIVSFKGKLDSLNPKAVLKRGYSIVENSEGVPVDSAKKLKTSDEISLVFYDGSLKARVE